MCMPQLFMSLALCSRHSVTGCLRLPSRRVDNKYAPVMLQVSGGPVYVSDRPGKHNMELLKRMVLPDGNVLLCTQPGRPTLDCLFADCMRDKQTLLKVSSCSEVYW